jgi:hypothetical protein
LLIRIYRTVAAAAVCLLAAVGGVVLAVVAPFALVMVIAVGSVVGGMVATQLPRAESPGGVSAPRRTRHPNAAGVAAAMAAVTVSVLLAMAGSAALLGAAAAPVYLLLLLGVGAGLWRHRAAWRAYATAVASTATPAADLDVRALCLAWQCSHRSLDGLPAGPARTELVATRERLLDELEQRDPVGFRQWLHRGVHASSDPSHYLTGNRPSTARIPRGNDSSAS